MLNFAQIHAIIMLLVAFNVPQTTINNVQAILNPTIPMTQSEPISSSAPEVQPTPDVVDKQSESPACTVVIDPSILINKNGLNTPTVTTTLPMGKNAYFNVTITNCAPDSTYTWSDENGLLWSGNIISDMGTKLPVPDAGLYYRPTEGAHTLTFIVSSGTDTVSSSITVTGQ